MTTQSKDQRPRTTQGKQAAQWVLASRCPRCGGAKTRPSLTAYVYCDYCGSLADYDFRKACEAPAQLPGPVYEALLARLNKPLEKAFAIGAGAPIRRCRSGFLMRR